MAPPQIPGVDIPLITGPLALGYNWGYMLFGILCVQSYIYYVQFPKDHKGIKILVWSLFVLELLFTIFCTIAVWNQYGRGWGDPASLLIIDWSWIPLPPLNGTISLLSQSFYVWRIYSLTRNIWICGAIESVALMQCVMVWYFGCKVTAEGRGITALFALSPFITAWLSGSAITDVLITIVIVFVLTRANRKTKFRQTTSRITRLIRFTVETGLVTSVMALAELILWLTTQQFNIHFIGFLVLGRLYTNALVATLNSRASIFGDPGSYRANTGSMPQTSSAFWDDAKGSRTGSSSASTLRPAVHVARTRETHVNPHINHEMHLVNPMDSKNGTLAGNVEDNTKYGAYEV